MANNRPMTEDEKKLLQTQHRMEAIEARNCQKERKARTRRLILPCVNCLRKPATGSFIAEIGAASDSTYFLFRKKKQKCAAAREGGK